MPRKTTSGKNAPSRISPRPLQKPPTPAPPPQHANNAAVPAPNSKPAGSILGGIAGTIADGMAFGTGSAVAHRAVDAVLGPRVVQREHPTTPSQIPATPVNTDSCAMQAKSFQECISGNGSDISACQFYLDTLNECRKRSTVNF